MTHIKDKNTASFLGLFLVVLMGFSQVVSAYEIDSKRSKKEVMRTLYYATHQDPKRLAFVTDDSSLYVDLVREIELSKRERGNRVDQNRYIKEVKDLNEELTKRLTELDEVKERLKQKVNNKQKDNANLDHLITLYESISADQAAGLMRKLPIRVATRMMQKMSPRKSSKILAAMDEKYAAEMSKRLLRQPNP